MTIYLYRHAKAGDRSSWDGDDFFRPLSRRGQVQAAALVDQFRGVHLDHLFSSPYVRCVESLVPLASDRVLAIEPVDALAEGGPLDPALTLMRKHTHRNVIMCSHGDIIPMILEHYAAHGVDLGPDPACPKGCTWT